MHQRLHELACVLLGHDWELFDEGMRKHCQRCYRNDLNL